MRIWHQSLTVMGDVPGYQSAVEAHIARVVEPGTEVVLHGMLPSTFPSDFPLNELQYPALAYYHFNQLLSGAIAAEQQGFDAYAISTLPDYALVESRSLVDIPVVAYGESAMLFSCTLGRRFGVLAFIEELCQMVEENARRYGLGERCAGSRPVGDRKSTRLNSSHT